MSKRGFLSSVQKEVGIEDESYAELATEAVLNTLRDRLTEAESKHVEAHLPRELKCFWSLSLTERLLSIAHGPTKMTKKEFLAKVQDRSHVADIKKSETLTRGVFKTLKDQLPDADADGVASQLPRDLKNLWKIS